MKSKKQEQRIARRSVRRQRGRRFVTGVNVFLSILLAAVLTGMVNYIASRYYGRWTLHPAERFELSGKTQSLIADLDAEVQLIAFFRKNHYLFDSMKKLLREYRYAAGKADPVRLRIRLVDPDRDLVEARELKRKFDLAEADSVLIECEGRVKHIGEKELADHEIEISEGGAVRRWTAFKGEQAVSSAIQSVVQSRRPVVYFLGGHGERAVSDFSKHAGFSTIGRVLARDNIEVRELLLTDEVGIPKDCSALIIAGPDRSLQRAELTMLSRYLDQNGRVLMLLDPATETGLEPLLKKWGIHVYRDVVVDPTRTLTGRELVVATYGEHAITRRLRNVTTVFYMPRSVVPAEEASNASAGVTDDDRPHVSALASCTPDGWAEMDVEQRSHRFDPEVDRRGPIPVAVAAEKGKISGIDIAMKPTRLAVIGDSYFVANGALNAGGGGNVDFFMSVINWLVERDALMAIGPKAPGSLSLEMTRRQWRVAYLVIAVGIPAGIAFIGLVIWFRRRR